MATREQVVVPLPADDPHLPALEDSPEVSDTGEEPPADELPTPEPGTAPAAPTSGTASPGAGSGEPTTQPPRPSAETLLLQQRIQELEGREQQRAWDALRQKHQEELRSYEQDLLGQGLEPAQVQRSVKSLQELHTEREQLHNERLMLQRNAQMAAEEQKAKLYWADHYAKEFGVPVQDLLKANTPTEMENAGLKAKVAKLTQGQLPRAQTDNNRAGPSTRGNRAARITQLTDKATLSDKEVEELGTLMGGR